MGLFNTGTRNHLTAVGVTWCMYTHMHSARCDFLRFLIGLSALQDAYEHDPDLLVSLVPHLCKLPVHGD